MMQDRLYRKFFSHLRMVRDFLEGYVKEPWVQSIDWKHPEPRRLDPQHVVKGLVERKSDTAWLLGWSEHPGSQFCVTVEVQSTVERIMPLRSDAYRALMQHGLVRYERLRLPVGAVVSIMLYTGRPEWSKEKKTADLILPMTGLEKWRSPFESIMVDAYRRAADELDGWNAAQAMIRLIVTDPEDWPGMMAVAAKELATGAPEDESLMHTFEEAVIVAYKRGFPGKDLSEIPTMKGGWQMLGDRVVEWKAQLEQKALEQGIRQGERRMLVAIGRDRYGEEVARAVDARLAAGAGNGASGDVLELLLHGQGAEEVLHGLKEV